MAELDGGSKANARYFLTGAFLELRKGLGIDGLLLSQVGRERRSWDPGRACMLPARHRSIGTVYVSIAHMLVFTWLALVT
jgi:hypothetical protein